MLKQTCAKFCYPPPKLYLCRIFYPCRVIRFDVCGYQIGIVKFAAPFLDLCGSVIEHDICSRIMIFNPYFVTIDWYSTVHIDRHFNSLFLLLGLFHEIVHFPIDSIQLFNFIPECRYLVLPVVGVVFCGDLLY